MGTLLERLSQNVAVAEELLDAASELDKAYLPARYPDALPEGAPFQRYRRPEAQTRGGDLCLLQGSSIPNGPGRSSLGA
ncbi:hypothetical protein YIM1640_17340 [Thermus oshimai]